MLGVLLTLCVFVLALLEIGLRTFGSLEIHYYTGTKRPGVHHYPYGDVPINSAGYPDEEYVVTDGKRHIGYVGDSVTYGVGTGYGYRIPDLLQAKLPQYDHWVFANVGDRLTEKTLVSQVNRFKLNSVIYLMNLNDIVPDSESAESSTWIVSAQEGWFGRVDAALRGHSYLYTYLRLGIKNGLQRLGYEHHGMPAFELMPSAHGPVIDATAKRVADALKAASGGQADFRSCVVILPYEMQVSADAARVYRGLGFSWEQGFETGSTQQKLLEAFGRLGVTAFDSRDAFSGTDLKVGEAFVYNKGDKIDWNHPNRRGHALIAAWLETRPGIIDRCYGPAHE